MSLVKARNMLIVMLSEGMVDVVEALGEEGKWSLACAIGVGLKWLRMLVSVLAESFRRFIPEEDLRGKLTPQVVESWLNI